MGSHHWSLCVGILVVTGASQSSMVTTSPARPASRHHHLTVSLCSPAITTWSGTHTQSHTGDGVHHNTRPPPASPSRQDGGKPLHPGVWCPALPTVCRLRLNPSISTCPETPLPPSPLQNTTRNNTNAKQSWKLKTEIEITVLNVNHGEAIQGYQGSLSTGIIQSSAMWSLNWS